MLMQLFGAKHALIARFKKESAAATRAGAQWISNGDVFSSDVSRN